MTIAQLKQALAKLPDTAEVKITVASFDADADEWDMVDAQVAAPEDVQIVHCDDPYVSLICDADTLHAYGRHA